MNNQTNSADASMIKRIQIRCQQHIHQAMGSLSDVWRTPIASLMTMLVLGVSLALPSTLYVVLKNSQTVSAQWTSPTDINLFLKKDLPESRYKNLLQRLKTYKEVDSFEYISKAQGMEEFKRSSGLVSALTLLDHNPLPAVVVVTPKPYYRSSIAAQELLAKLVREPEVQQGKLDIMWLERLDGILSILSDAVLVVSTLLLSSVLLITGNTIRLNILSNRAEIEVLKLIGATNSFVQRPFLYTGFWYGAIGGILAWLVTIFMVYWMEDTVLNLAQLYNTDFVIEGLTFSEVILLFSTAISMGLISAAISVNYYIAKIEPS
ncbi:permease-like cell division protein FtsX [Moritella sp. Urea-trap-13]|uniref:permease-like cell division protein FtsX n=1 Tax=Moritella sp. Urea-trap-13 TaxID=2058327 RepID=UPI000C346FDB|nr:permease-like cell division protein FtsX [Moritella sp. Urea-trap-13]PKH05059.1 cell division protein FtsX [Moritella sp. Urea-trap-13]